MNRFLFVCTGNTCRSPMAEGIFRRLAQERGIAVEVRSAGVAAFGGQPMAKHSEDVLASRGIDTKGFRSLEVTEELVAWADVILTMTTSHKRHLVGQFPDAVEKTFALKEFACSSEEAAKLRDREQLMAELQMKMALGQTIADEERNRLNQLERELPDVDIPDPIGGSRTTYEVTAKEIEAAAAAVLDRIGG